MLPINKTIINNSQNWQKKHWETIKYSYSKTPFFKEISSFFEKLYLKKNDRLVDLNLEIIFFLADFLKIKTKIILASEINPAGKKTDLLVDICEKLKGDSYLSGIGGKNYLEEDKFKNKNILVKYQNFPHPFYSQKSKEFFPYMSIIDAISNTGKEKTLELIRQNND
jgi:hypothetical protein